jgi:hypothetical protein
VSAWAILRNRQEAGARSAANAEVFSTRDPRLLPDDRVDALCREAWSLARSGGLASEAEIDAFMRKNGVKHSADRAKINDAIYDAIGYR